MDKAVIKTKNLSLYYGSFKALDNINLDILPNKVTALIGPSGCGKSTFLRSLNRMNDLIDGVKTEGEVLYSNQNIYNKCVDITSLRKDIGMVFQRPNPFPSSVYDNVIYGPKVHGINNKEKQDVIVRESLESVGLWKELKDCLFESALSLPPYQQQTLCIARLLAVKPEVLLMDEPCSALDPIATAKVEELIHELKKNYTVVIVTHNMQQAARISDRTGYFLLGKLIEFDDTQKIFTNPAQKETEDYISGKYG
ncbi:MAG: phosphate ABC transporter ATP-binding protein PstB [Armatimonadota bacterium]